MPTMKFANVLLETNPRSVAYPGLYCRSDQPVVHDPDSGDWEMYAAGTYDFTTYFNSLSVEKLLRYTKATGFALHLELKGAACTVTETYGDAFAAHPIAEGSVSASLPASDGWQVVDLPLLVTDRMVIVGFSIATEGRVAIRNSYYSLDVEGGLRDVELAIGTTTFKKESFIINNIGLVRKEILSSSDDIARHFHMYVIDNGRTLDAAALSGDGVTVIPNDNVGGAGGFTRGMITAMEQTPQATNILLMDDDVAVSPESIKRTYNLLRILKPEYEEAMISGAMLNYEVGEEQWEDIGHMTPEGIFSPCKPPLQLTHFEDLVYNEKFRPTKQMKQDMYAAWWYCCIPISVIKRNGLPLPVFVQAVMGMAPDADFLKELHKNVHLELKKFGYADAELCLNAFEDFLKGPDFFIQPGVAEQTFMKANKDKEKLYDFVALQEQIDADPDLAGLKVEDIDRQLIDEDQPRSLQQRLQDYTTDNWQRGIKREGKGYAVIPLAGWIYPAGVIRGKKKLVAIDWYNRKGAIRTKDAGRYADIMKRYHRDLRYYKKNIDRLRREYAAIRPTVTSLAYWKNYLKME